MTTLTIRNIRSQGVVYPIEDEISRAALALKVDTSDIVDNLTTEDSTKPLSAKQGKVLDGKITSHETADNPHGITKSTIGLGNVVDGAQINVIEEVQKNGTPITVVNKVANITITKSDVGLNNVNNTSDANKPISNATQTALDKKVDTDAPEIIKLASLNTSMMVISSSMSVPASSFSLQSTPDVADYPYAAFISLSGMTSEHFAAVVFSQADASSGNLSNICSSASNGINIYAKTQPTATVVVESISAWKLI